MVERKVKVAIPCGIHIRPAGIISHTANSFKADSRIVFFTFSIFSRNATIVLLLSEQPRPESAPGQAYSPQDIAQVPYPD